LRVGIRRGCAAFFANRAQQQLGPVSLVSSSLVSFVTSPAVLHFADSHGQPLNPSGVLAITNWNGSPNGGGNHQLIFGNNAQGWSQAQLSKTLFLNPGGFAPGVYGVNVKITLPLRVKGSFTSPAFLPRTPPLCGWA